MVSPSTSLRRLPRKTAAHSRTFVLDVLNGSKHAQALIAYSLVVFGHFSEHLVQVGQVFWFGWARAEAGGILGLYFSGVAENEFLHFTYNGFQLTGLILLAYGFRRHKAAHRFWIVALVAQSWHWLEHAFLIVQMLTGHYFYAAVKQMSVLERFAPRIELHFVYNLAVFVPTVIAIALYAWQRERFRREPTA